MGASSYSDYALLERVAVEQLTAIAAKPQDVSADVELTHPPK
jgi:hypothetical protein